MAIRLTLNKLLLVLLLFFLQSSICYSAVIINDTFTETSNTNISAHTPDIGGAWSAVTNVYVNAASDNLQNSGDDGGWVYSTNNASVGDDEMDITAKLTISTADCCRATGIYGRIPAGDIGSNNSYGATLAWPNANKDVTLRKSVGGSGTALGTYANNDTDATIKLEIRDAAKKVYVDGVERLSSVDNNLTGNNYAGVLISNKWSQNIDNYLVESVAAAVVDKRRIILTYNISDYFVEKAHADVINISSADIQYFTSPICGDGVTVNITTGQQDFRRPCITDTYNFPSWILIHESNDTMTIKAMANTTLQATIPKKYKVTKNTLSTEARDYITLRGEGKISGY